MNLLASEVDSGNDKLAWKRASRCGGTACVEVAFLADAVAVRDSKQSHGPVLVYGHEEWRVFLDGAKAGEFDLSVGCSS